MCVMQFEEMSFQVEGIEIDLTNERHGVRLKTPTDNLLLANQTFDEVEQVIRRNFETVRTFYQERADETVSFSDLNLICLKIVFRFFYMHNMWRNEGKRLKNKALEFLAADLTHPYSYDEVIDVLRKKHPSDYSTKCGRLLKMTPDEFKKYEKDRQAFFDMW